MNYKIEECGNTQILGVREGYSFKEIDRGNIFEDDEKFLHVEDSNELENFYLIKDESLIEGPKGVAAWDYKDEWLFYRIGFEYGLCQLSDGRCVSLGSYCKDGIFYRQTETGVILQCLLDDKLVEFPFISVEQRIDFDDVAYSLIQLGENCFKVVSSCDVNEQTNLIDYFPELFLYEADISILIFPSMEDKNVSEVYFYNEETKTYSLIYKGENRAKFENAIVTGSDEDGELWFFENGERKLTARGRVTKLDAFKIDIGGYRYLCSKYKGCLDLEAKIVPKDVVQPVQIQSISHAEGESRMPAEDKTVYLEEKQIPKRPETSKGSSQKTLWDRLLPWRWFQ